MKNNELNYTIEELDIDVEDFEDEDDYEIITPADIEDYISSYIY